MYLKVILKTLDSSKSLFQGLWYKITIIIKWKPSLCKPTTDSHTWQKKCDSVFCFETSEIPSLYLQNIEEKKLQLPKNRIQVSELRPTFNQRREEKKKLHSWCGYKDKIRQSKSYEALLIQFNPSKSRYIVVAWPSELHAHRHSYSITLCISTMSWQLTMNGNECKQLFCRQRYISLFLLCVNHTFSRYTMKNEILTTLEERMQSNTAHKSEMKEKNLIKIDLSCCACLQQQKNGEAYLNLNFFFYTFLAIRKRGTTKASYFRSPWLNIKRFIFCCWSSITLMSCNIYSR